MSKQQIEPQQEQTSSGKRKSSRLRRYSMLGLEALLFIAIIFLVMKWQERKLLSNSSNPKAPSSKLVAIDGTEHLLPSPSQKQLLYFFAPWCTICDISISNIEGQKDNLLNKGYQVSYVALSWQNKQEIEQFSKDHKLSFPVLLGNQQTAIDYQINGFPTYYIINEQGLVVAGSQGYSSSLGIWLRSL